MQWPGHRDDVRPSNWWGRDPDSGVANTGSIARLGDPFLPDGLRQHMLAQGLSRLPFSRHYSHLPMSREIHRRDAISFGTELSGRLTDRIDWRGFLRWGMVEDDITTTNMVGRQEWLLARDVALDEVFQAFRGNDRVRYFIETKVPREGTPGRPIDATL